MKRSRYVRPVSRLGLAVVLSWLPAAAQAQSSVELVEDFPIDEVTVDDPYYKQLFEVDVDYILSLDPVRLMAGFKAVSQNQNPATEAGLYGGWEGGWSLLRGHTIGHYLSAMARAYRQILKSDPTRAQQIKNTIDSTVTQLRAYQVAKGNGYLFASPETHFDVVEGRVTGDQWAPWYTMHKIISGILDVHELTGNTVALDIASSLGDWTYNRTSKWDSAMRNRALGIEYGGMNDCLYELYKYTKSPHHLTAAHTFDEEKLFDPISQGTDVLNGKHANTQIPKVIGSLNRYRTLGAGESHYFDVADEFWSLVLKNHTYVTGGNSELEHFREPGKLDKNRDNTNNETCNSYNMLKLTHELFKVTPDVKYADYYERGFINEILTAINPETGMTTYFKPMGTGHFKAFGRKETFWCCNGTGMENYTKLGDGIYFHYENDLYVNMYVSSTLDWESRGLKLHQTADVPLSPLVTFTIDTAPTDAITVKFRKPWWLALDEPSRITVNGQPQCIQSASGYFDLTRVWSAGDVIEVTLPADVRVSRLPDNQNAVAFTYGPVVLSAGMGTEQMVTEPQWASEKSTIPAGVSIKQTIAIQSGSIEDWISNITQQLVQTPGTLDFSLAGTDEDDNLTFSPQYLRYGERYGIYFVLEGEQGVAPEPAVDPGDASTDCEGASEGTGGAGSGTGGATSGSGGSPASGGSVGGGGTPAAGTETGGSSEPTSGASDSTSGCGCSVPGRRSPGPSSVLNSLLGLFMILRLRRRRAPDEPDSRAYWRPLRRLRRLPQLSGQIVGSRWAYRAFAKQ